VTTHKQLPFRLADNTHTEVDEGLYELLMLLRDLGVKTQYSCEGGRFSAYVVGDAESFLPVIEKLQEIQSHHYVLQKIFEKPVEETWFHQEMPAVTVVDMDEPYRWYKWELDHHGDMGDRYVLRWKPKATRLFVEALQELQAQSESAATTQLKEHFNV
jgi:hypothetical protein